MPAAVIAADRAERRSVVLLLLGIFFSSAASLAQATVLGKLLFDLTGSSLDLGLLGLAEFAPAALLVLVTGSIADRRDRRRVASFSMFGEAAAVGVLAWYAGSGHRSTLPIFGLVIVFGVARAFAAPSARSLPADTVSGERLPWLIARWSGTWQVASIFGPVLGGFLYSADVRFPFIADAVMLVLAGVAFLGVQVKQTGRPLPVVAELDAERGNETVETGVLEAESSKGKLHEALEGLRFIRQRPILFGAISLDLFAVLFGGAVALLPAIATKRLHVDSVGLGWLRAAGGIGAASVTALLAVRPLRRKVGKRLLIAVGTFGAATVVLGVTRSYLLAFVAMAVLSGADAVSVFVRATLVPLVTPADKRGRVLAVENVFIGASNELGAFESGVAGSVLGLSGAVVLGGVATLAVAGTWAGVFPALRDVDGFPQPEDDLTPT